MDSSMLDGFQASYVRFWSEWGFTKFLNRFSPHLKARLSNFKQDSHDRRLSYYHRSGIWQGWSKKSFNKIPLIIYGFWSANCW